MSNPCVPCYDYRAELRLLSLRRQLEQPDLSQDQRRQMEKEVDELERQLKMD